MRLNYTMVFVSDMEKSVAFYRDQLGIPLRFQSPAWTEFATEGATLALHKADNTDHGPHPSGNCRPGFAVPNLQEFHQRMVLHAVPCVQEPKSVFGAMVAQYEDPDGLVFSVGEERKGP